MTQTAAKFQSYADGFLALTQGFNGDVPGGHLPGWAQELRDTGWSKFNELGFPTARRGNETMHKKTLSWIFQRCSRLDPRGWTKFWASCEKNTEPIE